MVQPLWKTVWRFFKKLKLEPLRDLAISVGNGVTKQAALGNVVSVLRVVVEEFSDEDIVSTSGDRL